MELLVATFVLSHVVAISILKWTCLPVFYSVSHFELVQLKSYSSEAQGSIEAFNSLHCCRSVCTRVLRR